MKGWISAFVFFCLAAMANTAAATTYVYTGSNFTSVTGAYTTSMKITGSFTTVSPLTANLTAAQIGPGGLNLVTGWSFNDGLQTLTNLNSQLPAPTYFTVSTDAAGNITAFQIAFENPTGTNTVGQAMNIILVYSGAPYQGAVVGSPCTFVTSGKCTSAPGTSATDFAIGGSASGTFAIATATATASAPMLAPSLLALLALVLLACVYRIRRHQV